jgi:hypothetical protein
MFPHVEHLKASQIRIRLLHVSPEDEVDVIIDDDCNRKGIVKNLI